MQKRRSLPRSSPGRFAGAARAVLPARKAVRRYFFFGSALATITLAAALVAPFIASNYVNKIAPALAEAAPHPPEIVSNFTQYSPALLSGRNVTFEPAWHVKTPTRLPLSLPRSDVDTPGVVENVDVTFYDCTVQGFCGPMFNGELVYEGAAACSWDLPIGTTFYITGDPTERLYVCKDRGLLRDTWVDIFWYSQQDGYSWQSQVGRYASIVIVSLPY